VPAVYAEGMRRVFPLAVLVILAGATGAAAQQTPPGQPEFKVQIWGFAAADFATRMSEYEKLRAKLQRGLPELKVTDDPRDIFVAERALAARIRVARAGSRRGGIFTPEIAAAFREVLRLETRTSTCATIRDDNPGELEYRTNGSYPKDEPLSTVPVGILNLLPSLPEDVNYRFVGRHLILHDTRANVILDRLSNAMRC
jgi:hypothetical protein